MAAGYLLALPMLALLVVGFVRLVVTAARDADPRRASTSALFACLLAVSLSSAVYYSLQAPMYSAVKAFFVLGIIGPVAVAVGEGWAVVKKGLASRRLAPVRLAVDAWLGTVLVVAYLSFLA